MITVKLMGGLGNQLFQYSLGRRLSIERGSDLILDLKLVGRDYEDIYAHDFQLDDFDINAEVTDSSDRQLGPDEVRRKAVKGASMLSPRLSTMLFGEYRETAQYEFDPAVLNLSGDVTLHGYWQSWKYFDTIREELLSELTLKNGSSVENQRLESEIAVSTAVSLHVRRGDYVNMGMDLPPAYYRRALQRITEDLNNPTVFVFSDDMEWVRQNESEVVPDSDIEIRYVTGNSIEDPHEDMRLMWSCDHNVISNSTFSWWGAWLNRKDEKRIVAPQSWFSQDVSELDIVPPEWDTVAW